MINRDHIEGYSLSGRYFAQKGKRQKGYDHGARRQGEMFYFLLPQLHLEHILFINFVKRNQKLMEIIFLVEESAEGGYTAKALGEDIFTQAESLEILKTNISDAVKCHLGDQDHPKIVRMHIVKDEVFSII